MGQVLRMVQVATAHSLQDLEVRQTADTLKLPPLVHQANMQPCAQHGVQPAFYPLNDCCFKLA
jgi:hypothetical protein